MIYRGQRITCLISDFVEGEILSEFLNRQRGKRISVFQAVHLLHALVIGIEQIHANADYHGDLHSDNVIIRRFGLGFDLKVLDLFHWGHASAVNRLDDLVDVIKLFHESIGGAKFYKTQPKEVKYICCGLKKSLIQKRFKNAAGLRRHLETMHWS
jgi:tRNA A-37 threonylcarbamoyl transferase component Bud32